MTVNVLSVVSEAYPLVKTGGLADVAGALPGALSAYGVRVYTLVPGYPAVLAALESGGTVLSLPDLFGGPARLRAGRAGGLDVFVVDAPHLYDRPGNPYTGPDGRDWPDNAFRFAALAWMGALIALGNANGYRPHVVHGHDWQAGLLPAYLAYDGRPHPPAVMTIHNLAFQGQFPAELLSALRLPSRAYAMEGVEYYGSIGFLKAGLYFADRITTVSPTYAHEIQTPEFGFGMDGLLRHRAGLLSGIVNGIDTDTWNPATDPRIPVRYSPDTIAQRAGNKRALQARLGLASSDRPVFGVTSRLTWQKGMDLLADALPRLVGAGAQLALLGTGDAELEKRFGDAALAYPGQVGKVIGYDEDLAHLIQAGADAFLVPSRFEPCGLTQLCAQRYGALPVVARVGGLADTVADPDTHGIDRATGIQFHPPGVDALAAAIERTADLWRRPDDWRRMQRNAMETDVSWSASAGVYARLYRELAGAR